MAGGERPVRGPAVNRQRGASRFMVAARRARSGSPPRRGTGMTRNSVDGPSSVVPPCVGARKQNDRRRSSEGAKPGVAITAYGGRGDRDHGPTKRQDEERTRV